FTPFRRRAAVTMSGLALNTSFATAASSSTVYRLSTAAVAVSVEFVFCAISEFSFHVRVHQLRLFRRHPRHAVASGDSKLPLSEWVGRRADCHSLDEHRAEIAQLALAVQRHGVAQGAAQDLPCVRPGCEDVHLQRDVHPGHRPAVAHRAAVAAQANINNGPLCRRAADAVQLVYADYQSVWHPALDVVTKPGHRVRLDGDLRRESQ